MVHPEDHPSMDPLKRRRRFQERREKRHVVALVRSMEVWKAKEELKMGKLWLMRWMGHNKCKKMGETISSVRIRSKTCYKEGSRWCQILLKYEMHLLPEDPCRKMRRGTAC